MKIYTTFVGVALWLAVTLAHAACTPDANTYCVTSSADSDGSTCMSGTPCTLRQAINAANAAAGAKTIGFAIAGTGPFAINLASALPMLNPNGTLTSVTIDGYSQPGSVMNTNTPDQGGLNTQLMIEIAGSGSTTGFNFSCCAYPPLTVTLQGLNLHGFSNVFQGQTYGNGKVDQWNVYGCFIGTNVDGTAVGAPAGGGLYVGYDSAHIGGTSAWQRNLISGSNGYGMSAGFPGETVVVEGNLIGTDASGTQAIANPTGLALGGDLPGLRVGCTGAGCTAPGHPSRNVISGNRQIGIDVQDVYSLGTGGIQIKGNYIGTDWSGTKPLANGTTASGVGCPTYCGGIELSSNASSPALVIGGFGSGEANLIAHNLGYGIAGYSNEVGASFDNQGNAIHNNWGADIAFNLFDGWIANDPGDADTGTNNKQNYPVIQSAAFSGDQLTVTYLVDTMWRTQPIRCASISMSTSTKAAARSWSAIRIHRRAPDCRERSR